MALQLTPALEQRLHHLAAMQDRTPDDLAEQLVEQSLAYEEDILATIQRGRDDVAAGRVFTHQEVVSRIEKLLEPR
jgi:predicted transcriptional regulator